MYVHEFQQICQQDFKYHLSKESFPGSEHDALYDACVLQFKYRANECSAKLLAHVRAGSVSPDRALDWFGLDMVDSPHD